MSTTSKMIKGYSYVSLDNFAFYILGFAYWLLTAWFLTPDQLGLVTFAISTVGFGQLFSDLRLGLILRRYIAEFSTLGEENKIRACFRFVLKIRFVIATVFCIFFIILADYIAIFFQNPGYAFALRVAALSILFGAFTDIVMSMLEGLQEFKKELFFTIFRRSALIFFFVLFVIIGGLGAIGALLGFSLAPLIIGILFLFLILRKFEKNAGSGNIELDLGRILEYSKWMVVSSITFYLYLNINFLILTYFFDLSTVSYYKVAATTLDNILGYINVSGRVLEPMQTSFFVANKNANFRKLEKTYFESTKYAFFSAIPIIFFTFLLADSVISLLYPSIYSSAVIFLIILSFGYVARSVTISMRSTFAAIERPDWIAKYYGLMALVNTITALFLIPFFQEIAVAIAFSLGSCVGVLYSILKTKSFLKTPFPSIPVFKYVLASIFFYIVCYGALRLFSSFLIYNFIIILVIFILGFILYIPTVIFLGGIKHEDLDRLKIFIEKLPLLKKPFMLFYNFACVLIEVKERILTKF
ncbi:MAG: oligosaccharide flippase family protein [Promethearchaeota archaeon]